MNDPYLYEGTSVLRNLLNIHDEKELDVAEAEISSANMMLLYDKGFSDFTTEGIKEIHKTHLLHIWMRDMRNIGQRIIDRLHMNTVQMMPNQGISQISKSSSFATQAEPLHSKGSVFASDYWLALFLKPTPSIVIFLL